MVDIDNYEKKYGKWTAHCVEYAPGKFTMSNKNAAGWIASRAKTYAFLSTLFMNKPFANCRILDIGCFEGGLAYHFAKMGAETVGIEMRDVHLGKCAFLKEAFPDLRLNFQKGNMLEISAETYGAFDIILLAGTLYHVDAPDIIPFLKRIRAMTTGVLVIDTRIARRILEYYDDPSSGLRICGRSFVEHMEGDSEEQKENHLWASHRNRLSFWMTERSLVNALITAGFSWSLKALAPSVQWRQGDRGVWLAGVCTEAKTGIAMPEIQILDDPDPAPFEDSLFQKFFQYSARNPNTKRI